MIHEKITDNKNNQQWVIYVLKNHRQNFRWTQQKEHNIQYYIFYGHKYRKIYNKNDKMCSKYYKLYKLKFKYMH